MSILTSLNVKTTCRACLLEFDELNSLFGVGAADQVSLANLMMACCAEVKIADSDGLPNQICVECTNQLVNAYNFKLKCEQSDKLLLDYISKERLLKSDSKETNILEYPTTEINIKTEEVEEITIQNEPLFKETETSYTLKNERSDSFDNYFSDAEDCIQNDGQDNNEDNPESSTISNIDNLLSCEVCDITFKSKKTLAHHSKTKHTGKNLKRWNICKTGFTKETQLETHLQEHLKLIAFKCLECNEEFETKLRLKQHRTVHQSNSRRTRQNNTETDLTSSEIKIEIGETDDFTCMPNGDKIIQCKICNIEFEKMFQLKEHINNHVNKETFKDIQFDQSGLISNLHFSSDELNINNNDIIDFIISEIKFGNISKFYSISNSVGTELTLSDSETETETDIDDINFTQRNTYTCQKCKKTFDRRYKILYHQKVFHSSDMAYQCKYCSMKFVSDDLLRHHLRHQCENVNKSFSCPDCNMKFMWHENLNIHKNHQHSVAVVKKVVKKTMQKEKTFFCMICDKSFFRQEHLDRHINIHQPNDKKFECPTCHKKFNRKDNMKSHMRIHRENREKDEKHLCVYCGRSFSNSSNLIVHMRRHTGEKPYKCDICDKGFPRSSDLQCHRRTHTGEKPCLCTICGKGFSRSNKLVRHMRIHTGIRPYKCTYCDRAFTQSNDLTLHIRRHTGDKPYVCGICGDRFIQGTALQTHRRLKGHYEEGNQEAPYASISIHNPNRLNFANRVDRIGLPKTPASEPVEIKPVGRGNSRINQSNRIQRDRNNILPLQPEVVINEPDCTITEPIKTLPHFTSPSVPTGSSSAYISNHVPYISLEEGDLFAISNLSYSQTFH